MSTKRTNRKTNDKLNLAFGTALVEKFISGRAFDRKFAKHLKNLGYQGEEFQLLLQQGRDESSKWAESFPLHSFNHKWINEEKSTFTPYLKGEHDLTIICEHPAEYPISVNDTKGMLVGLIGNGLKASNIDCISTNQDYGTLEMLISGVEATFILNKMIDHFTYYGVEDICVLTKTTNASFKITYA